MVEAQVVIDLPLLYFCTPFFSIVLCNVFFTFWGFLLFGDLPDQWTVIGALVIVASGIYVWLRERKVGYN